MEEWWWAEMWSDAVRAAVAAEVAVRKAAWRQAVAPGVVAAQPGTDKQPPKAT